MSERSMPGLVIAVGICQIVQGLLELMHVVLTAAGFAITPPGEMDPQFASSGVLGFVGLVGIASAALAVARIYAGARHFYGDGRTLGIVTSILGALNLFMCMCLPSAWIVGVFGLIVYANADARSAFVDAHLSRRRAGRPARGRRRVARAPVRSPPADRSRGVVEAIPVSTEPVPVIEPRDWSKPSAREEFKAIEKRIGDEFTALLPPEWQRARLICSTRAEGGRTRLQISVKKPVEAVEDVQVGPPLKAALKDLFAWGQRNRQVLGTVTFRADRERGRWIVRAQYGVS